MIASQIRATLHDAARFVGAFIDFAGWRAAAAAALVLLGALVDGIGLVMLVPVIGLAMGDPGSATLVTQLAAPLLTALGRQSAVNQVLAPLAVFATLMAVRGFVLARRDMAINRLQLEFVDAVRRELVRKLAAAPWRNVAGVRQARVVQALSVEMHQLGIAANAFLLCLVSATMLLAYTGFALILSPSTGAFAVMFALLATLVGLPAMRRARRIGRAITDAHFGMTDSALTFVSGLKQAIAQGGTDAFLDDYAALSIKAAGDRLAFMSLQTELRSISSLLTVTTGSATLVVGMFVFHLGPTLLIALMAVLSRMGGPALLVQQHAQQVLHSLPAHAAVIELERLLAAPAPTVQPHAASVANSNPGIVFDDVAFHHLSAQGRIPAILQANFVIPRGAFVGLSGPSGSGKTTFLDLLAGLLSPDRGTIYIGGEPQNKVERGALAYVAQDSSLFLETLEQTLRSARAGVTEADMYAALHLAGADSLILRHPDGIRMRVSERGALISGGERQRLALARALLRRPSMLILDEATSAIDLESESEILARLARIDPRPTIFFVSHRRESLACCDHMLVFPGPILATGHCQSNVAGEAMRWQRER